MSFAHALEILRRDVVPVSAAPGAPVKKSTVPKLPSPVTLGADDRTLLREVMAFYHETLKQTPVAQQYLTKRGLQSAEMVERFRATKEPRKQYAQSPAITQVFEGESLQKSLHSANFGVDRVA